MRELAQGVRALAAGLAARGFSKGESGRLHAEHPRVRDRVPRRGLGRRQVHHRQPALHGQRARRTSSRIPARASCSPCRPSSRPPCEARRGAPASRRSSCSARARARSRSTELLGDPAEAPEPDIDPGQRPRRAAVLERHHRPAQGRDAHPPQPRRQPRARSTRLSRSTHDDTLIGVLPFFHIYGMTVIMNQGLRSGATIVTMPRFDLERLPRPRGGARASPAPTSCRRSRSRSPSTRPSRVATSRRCRP